MWIVAESSPHCSATSLGPGVFTKRCMAQAALLESLPRQRLRKRLVDVLNTERPGRKFDRAFKASLIAGF